MESVLTSRSTAYRLLYVHPEPASDERVCVGVVLRDGARSRLVYDASLTRLRCLAPSIDGDMLRYYLETCRVETEASNAAAEEVLRGYSPMLTTSGEREVASPDIEAVLRVLLDRFVYRRTPSDALETALSVNVFESISVRDHVQAEIADFAERLATPLGRRVIRQAKPVDVLGTKVPGIGRIAAAVESKHGIVLIDGINLRTTRPRAAVNQANRVVHTFWQYGKVEQRRLTPRNIQRVGIVLNGSESVLAAYEEAHQYALDQFRKEADVTIDGDSPGEVERLREQIAG